MRFGRVMLAGRCGASLNNLLVNSVPYGLSVCRSKAFAYRCRWRPSGHAFQAKNACRLLQSIEQARRPHPSGRHH